MCCGACGCWVSGSCSSGSATPTRSPCPAGGDLAPDADSGSGTIRRWIAIPHLQPVGPSEGGYMRKERDLRARFLDVVREMGKELDEFVDTGARTDLMPEGEAIEYLVKANDRLVAKQRHLLELVCLLVELADFADVDAGPHLKLVT